MERVSGLADQYTYDLNGNEKRDDLNQNHDFVYDNRNLLIEFKNSSSQFTTWTKYTYDEAGNRIRKTVYMATTRGGINGEGDAGQSWNLVKDEFYVRDVAGKEIAIYSGTSIQQWNVWGIDNVGKIKADSSKYFYLKDHLGSIRAVIDKNNNLVSAQDYDAWGYLMSDRNYQSDQSRYKFTSNNLLFSFNFRNVLAKNKRNC